jgi:hypothetical protein
VQTETILILLFSVAAAVVILVRQLHVPYTVALVLPGLALGILKLFTPPNLTDSGTLAWMLDAQPASQFPSERSSKPDTTVS